ncbi:hypothetical protein D9758_003485 [Tetrapyrgos nigripes]|uniref:Amidohydrolase-related domain-containing protein n=1 Tax=Tetrapyrgos nigripes TaxID=182062 RepID=A0A8H5GV92_9AGAR|nr:hypothetical protein D9758_003485 [Tetrapyrgos nigripes]
MHLRCMDLQSPGEMKLVSLLLPALLLGTRASTTLGAREIDFDPEDVKETIIRNAAKDNIDLTVLPFLDDALTAIVDTYAQANEIRQRARNGTHIDVHTGSPTPTWNLTEWLDFMDDLGVGQTVFSFSTPGANIPTFQGNETLTVAVARVMNEQLAALVRILPGSQSQSSSPLSSIPSPHFKFYAILPLPYASSAIVEAKYAVSHLGASGFFLMSNFDDNYLGSEVLRPFLKALEDMGSKQVVIVHPTTPFLRVSGASCGCGGHGLAQEVLVEANPTTYKTGIVEFYFETARTMEDLVMTQTALNFTNIQYVIPHVGGAFPAIFDRMMSERPDLYNATLEALKTRFYWDSAGPTYFHQVAGLLGYGIPKSQLLYGTDFPYAHSGFTDDLGHIETSPLLTDEEKEMLLVGNARRLFGFEIEIEFQIGRGGDEDALMADIYRRRCHNVLLVLFLVPLEEAKSQSGSRLSSNSLTLYETWFSVCIWLPPSPPLPPSTDPIITTSMPTYSSTDIDADAMRGVDTRIAGANADHLESGIVGDVRDEAEAEDNDDRRLAGMAYGPLNPANCTNDSFASNLEDSQEPQIHSYRPQDTKTTHSNSPEMKSKNISIIGAGGAGGLPALKSILSSQFNSDSGTE